MKKVLLVGEAYFDFAERVGAALTKLGYEVYTYTIPILSKDKKSLKEYFIYKMNKKRYREIYENQARQNLIEKIKKVKPDVFFTINPNYHYELVNSDVLHVVNAINSNCKKILKFDDSIQRQDHHRQFLDLYDEVLAFEVSDIQYISKKYGVEAKFITSSAAEKPYLREKSKENVLYDYDVCFVGSGSLDRLPLLEAVAEHCYHKGYKIIIYGGYYKERFFSKLKFKKKYPYLYKYVQNYNITAEEAAELYSKTKISLNIHISCHKSFNSRTFDILVGNNFVLSDFREDNGKYGFVDGESIVFYRNKEECLSKISYYIHNDEEREKIAFTGAAHVKKNFLVDKVLSKYL